MVRKSPYREASVDPLRLLVKASSAVRSQGAAAPVLVRGAVMEFDTASQIVSGEFDCVSTDDRRFAKASSDIVFMPGMAEVSEGWLLCIRCWTSALRQCLGDF